MVEHTGAPPLPPGQRIRLKGRGTTFVRRIVGPPDAPTLFLLHGWTATADLNWFRCYEALGRRYNVVAMDHRGHGRGIRSMRPFRLEDCADDVAAVVRQLDTGPVIPVGYSMGGPITQLFWRRHPDLVRGLVLCATSRTFAGRDPRTQAMFASMLGLSAAARLTPGAVRNRVAGVVLERRLDPNSPLQAWVTEEIRRNDAAAVLQAGWAIGRFDSRGWIGEVDVPTAVVVTARDQLVGPGYQRQLAESIPGATIHEVQADHAAVVLGADRFLPALLRAVDDVAGRLSPVASRRG